MKFDLNKLLTYPFDNDLLLRKQKRIRRELLNKENVSYKNKRIAILSGSTTDDIKNILEILLLNAGINPIFFQSEYNKYYEDAVFGNSVLDAFQPEIIIIFTSVVNIANYPQDGDDRNRVNTILEKEYIRFYDMWEALAKRYSAVIIQNNMELPYENSIGNLSAVVPYGMNRFVEALNARFADYAAEHDGFYLHDLHTLSAQIGLLKWHNRFQFYAYKFAMNYDVIPEVANGLAKIILAILGKNKKCLVLDLDNTLWGGIIGDDGVDGLILGNETPAGESYTAFQKYVLELKKRGIILAVCSKNDEEIAKSGFSHPDSVLKLHDFVAFYANWNPKNINIEAIAKEINIGTDSIVFIDDNPSERQLIRDTMPEVAVPEVNSIDVFSYIRAIEGAGYFEPIAISADDRNRNATYIENKQRRELASSLKSYDDFLKSLDMEAEIEPFKSIYFERISQLTNKSNQFNLTTRRFTYADIEQIASDEKYITLYGRLKDKFGDNGLVSVVVGEIESNKLHIVLWLMSCRVLKRTLENAVFDKLIEKAKKIGIDEIWGYYYKTSKNNMVKEFYDSLGFLLIKEDGYGSMWKLDLHTCNERKNKFIKINKLNY